MNKSHIAMAIIALLAVFLLFSGAGCSKTTDTTADAQSLDSDIADLEDFGKDLNNLDLGSIDDSELDGLEELAG